MNWFKSIIESVVAKMAAPMIEAAVAKAISDRNTAIAGEINLVAETLTAASVAEKMDARRVASHLRDIVDLSDLGLTEKDIADELNVREVARQIDMKNLADHIDISGIEVDYEKLAESIDTSDVASNMDFPSLAGEIDMSALAEEIDTDELAEKIDYRSLAQSAIDIAAGR